MKQNHQWSLTARLELHTFWLYKYLALCILSKYHVIKKMHTILYFHQLSQHNYLLYLRENQKYLVCSDWMAIMFQAMFLGLGWGWERYRDLKRKKKRTNRFCPSRAYILGNMAGYKIKEGNIIKTLICRVDCTQREGGRAGH